MKTIWHYKQFLPNIPESSRILLGEGNTPLIRSRAIGESLGVPELYFKLENINPSGSYKDRFASVFVSGLNSKKNTLCLATSSGNTGAALAAYCAAAGIKCVLVVVDGAPVPKIKQMQLYGAHTCMIRGFGKETAVTDHVFRLLAELAAELDIPLPISAYKYCPDGMSGVQTIAYEILESGDLQADHLFSPAGGGGLTLSLAKGCMAYRHHHPSAILPKLHCVQPEGNDTIAGPLRNNKYEAAAIHSSTTAISGLQVPGILDGNEVIKACRDLGGNGFTVKDHEVFAWQRILSRQEGIFCEPAGAVALAGFADAVRRKEISKDEKAVCLVTGSGFKDMRSVDQHFNLPEIINAESSALKNIINEIRSTQ